MFGSRLLTISEFLICSGIIIKLKLHVIHLRLKQLGKILLVNKQDTKNNFMNVATLYNNGYSALNGLLIIQKHMKEGGQLDRALCPDQTVLLQKS